MPYLAEFETTYRKLIRDYYYSIIDSSYSAYSSTMKSQVSTYLNAVATAEYNYKVRHNDITTAGTDNLGYLRFRWQRHFGFLTLYVLYTHCMQFPANTIDPKQGMMIPLNTGESLITGDDLRSFFTPWRYTWPGNGTTSYPWFSLSAGLVTPIDYGLGFGEHQGMINAFNADYPLYSGRYSNTGSYAIGAASGGVMATISDLNTLDQRKFYYNGINATIGFIDRMRYEFLNAAQVTNPASVAAYPRMKAGQSIIGYIAGGGPITMLMSPKEWMLDHGGQEIMTYFGWSDLSGATAVTPPIEEPPDDIITPPEGLGAGFGKGFGEEFA